MRKNRNKIKKNKVKNTISEVVKTELEPEKFDPFGSYTGITEDFERPVQDADDL